MAKDKNSFVLYCDQKHIFNELTDREAGKLIKHIFAYVNDENPITNDKVLKIAFEPIMRQLKRDLKDWEAERSKRSEAGKLGGIKSGESRRKRSKRSNASKNEANEAVNVNETDNVTVNVNEREVGLDAVVIYDAENLILRNRIEFERICIAAGVEEISAKESLRKYHLYLQEKEQYPKGRKAIFAGFEKWLMNEKKFDNGNQNRTSGKNNSHRPTVTGTASGAGSL